MSAVAPSADIGRRRSLQTLVLNADYRPLAAWPLSLIPARDAVLALYRERVDVVEQWDELIRSPSIEIRIPKIVALREYVPFNAAPKFCRRSILLRDHYCCQYCGLRFPADELTFDHLIPRSKGGRTTWENILVACVGCNGAKSDRHANHSGRKAAGQLRPLKQPRRPTTAELLRAGLEILPNDIREEFGSWLYWTADLQA